MNALAQPTTAFVVTPLLEAAAELELHAHQATQQVQTLQRDLQQLQRRQAQTVKWIKAIRRCHRSESHRRTAKLITQALAALNPAHTVVVPLF